MNGLHLSMTSSESSSNSRKQFFGFNDGNSSGSERNLFNSEPAQIKDFSLFDEFLSPPLPHPLDGMGSKQPLLHNMDSMSPSKKRKNSYDVSTFDRLDDDGSMDSSDTRKFARPSFESQSSNDRQNHSEIEKRRRDKMNAYITELSSMLPMCNAMNRKLDKLTVLRMAVQHIKSLRGAATTYTEASHRPSFLSEDELKHLILEAAEGFLFVVSCDRARILYASESVRNILCYSRNDLIGQSLLDYLHPKDINKVKEQLSSSDLAPRERLIDAKTMMPVKTELPQRPTHLSSGSRRSFFCRMKRGSKMSEMSGIKAEKYSDIDLCNRKKKFDRKSFIVIHCTGYLKSWPMSKMDVNDQDDSDDNCNLSCLVAIGQVKSPSDQMNIKSDIDSINLRPIEYTSRHSIDGKFTYIDQGATVLLGYLPQELLGTSVYEYYHQDDIMEMAEVHRKVLKTKEKFKTNVYRFKSKDGSFLHLRSVCFSFRNPWTKEVEYIVSKNTVVPVQEVSSSGQSVDAGGVTMELNEDSVDDAEGLENSRHIEKHRLQIPGLPGGTRPGAGRIGRQIADEILELQKSQESPHAVADSTNHAASSEQAKIVGRTSIPTATTSVPAAASSSSSGALNGGIMPTNRNGISVHVSAAAASGSATPTDTNLIENVMAEQSVIEEMNVSGNDGNDEAAMSIIMSLLEADAGLGGPIDFNDLPWPL